MQESVSSHTVMLEKIYSMKGALMTREYDEKRDFIRIDIDCEIAYKNLDKNGTASDGAVGQVANLSGRGLMFISDIGLEKTAYLKLRLNLQIF